MHEKNIAHRDLKLENVLLGEDGYVKLIDFGVAKRMEEGHLAMTRTGTPQYMAPEIYEGSGHGLAVDWWAVGILIFEMMFGNVPFYSKHGKAKMVEKILDAKVIFPDRARFAHFKYSDAVEDLVRKLLVRDPKERLGSKRGMAEVLEHEWFKDIDKD